MPTTVSFDPAFSRIPFSDNEELKTSSNFINVAANDAVYSQDGTLMHMDDGGESLGSGVFGQTGNLMRLHTMQDDMMPETQSSILMVDSSVKSGYHHSKHNSSVQ